MSESQQKTIRLGGTASDIVVAKVGHGLMRMLDYPEEDAFASIKGGIDALPPGVRMFLNSAEFYAPDHGPGNLELLARFFDKYPGYADKTFLSVKGGMAVKDGKLTVDGSPENLTRSIDIVLRALRGTKHVDLYECARIDTEVGVESMVTTIAGFIKEGKVGHVGLSECSAATIRRGHAVHPIAVVEIEISPMSYEEETKKVIATTKELGIAITAYSPVGRGLLTGTITKPSDVAADDRRRLFTRFQDESIEKNAPLVNSILAIAKRKGVTPAQLCIAWVGALGDHIMPLPGSSNITRTLENLAAGNIELTAEELAEIATVLDTHEVVGDRYDGGKFVKQILWG